MTVVPPWGMRAVADGLGSVALIPQGECGDGMRRVIRDEVGAAAGWGGGRGSVA